MEPAQIESNCPICYELMIEPTTFKCRHTFCLQCANQTVENSQMCPLCRQPITNWQELKVDKQLQEIFKAQEPKKFKKGYQFLLKRKLLEENMVKIRFSYGNTWKWNPKRTSTGKKVVNCHCYKVFLKCVSKHNIDRIVEKVKFELHPTYKQPLAWVRKSPFQISRTAYGYFDLPIHIYFRKKLKIPPKVLDYELQFDNPTAEKFFTIKIHKNLLNPKRNIKQMGKNKKKRFQI